MRRRAPAAAADCDSSCHSGAPLLYLFHKNSNSRGAGPPPCGCTAAAAAAAPAASSSVWGAASPFPCLRPSPREPPSLCISARGDARLLLILPLVSSAVCFSQCMQCKRAGSAARPCRRCFFDVLLVCSVCFCASHMTFHSLSCEDSFISMLPRLEPATCKTTRPSQTHGGLHAKTRPCKAAAAVSRSPRRREQRGADAFFRLPQRPCLGFYKSPAPPSLQHH